MTEAEFKAQLILAHINIHEGYPDESDIQKIKELTSFVFYGE